MVPIISIVGLSGSGKTTLLEKVVRELTLRGWSVGTIKHDVHGFDIDREGKDSFRHKKAGAVTVALSSPGRFAVIKEVKKEWPPERIIASYLSDVDVVVIEGFKQSSFPKIEVIRKANSKKPVCAGDKKLMAFASDFNPAGPAGKVPVYGIDDFKGISDLIEEKIIKKHQQKTVSLLVDGKEAALKPFIENLLREGIMGMIKSLKGCERPEEIEIRIRKK